LIAIHEYLPVRGLLTGVPFLLSLSSVADADESTDRVSVGRILVIREMISRVWLALGRRWDCKELVETAERVRDMLPLHFSLISSFSRRCHLCQFLHIFLEKRKHEI
jgi:hypothetical protein